jgi:hypothetical protein
MSFARLLETTMPPDGSHSQSHDAIPGLIISRLICGIDVDRRRYCGSAPTWEKVHGEM